MTSAAAVRPAPDPTRSSKSTQRSAGPYDAAAAAPARTASSSTAVPHAEEELASRSPRCRAPPSGSPIPPAHREPVSLLNDLALASLESLDATPRLRGRRATAAVSGRPQVRRGYDAARAEDLLRCRDRRRGRLSRGTGPVARGDRAFDGRAGPVHVRRRAAVKMVSALMETGLTAETIERAAAEGLLAFQRTDDTFRTSPARGRTRRSPSSRPTPGRGPSWSRRFTRSRTAEARSLGSDPRRRGGDARRFLQVWRSAPDEDSLLRAARLMAEGTRAAMLGWADLVDEQVVEPARRRLLRGELDGSPTRSVSRSRRRRGWCRRCSCG